MSLRSQLNEHEVSDIGEKKVRCPKCGKYIRLSQAHTDFVHRNCSTKWRIFGGDRHEVFKHELLNGKLLTGMLTEPPDVPRRKNRTIDKNEIGDFHFEV